MLDGLEQGKTPDQVISDLVNGRDFIEYRQLALIDAKGQSASFTGNQTLGTNAVVQGNDCIAAGNILITTAVPQAMADTFAQHSQLHLAQRLLLALQAGVDVGGEEGPVHSAGLKVAHIHPWPLVDLRVDWADDGPIAQLMDLWKAYQPQMMDYNSRAIDPSSAPSYGVPGDL
jgi:uncharacterized Ntn-hydrolase superfamily protein